MSENTAALIERLLASSKLSSDTRAELNDFKQDLANGKLDEADRHYIEALAQRLFGGARSAEDGAEPPIAGAEDDLWDLGEDPEVVALREAVEAAAKALREGLENEDPAALRVSVTAALGILESARGNAEG